MPVPFRPGVFACSMPQEFSVNPVKTVPSLYRAWPEIADPLSLYTLPTLYSISAISTAYYWPSNSNWISYVTIEEEEQAKALFYQNLPPGVTGQIKAASCGRVKGGQEVGIA